MACLKINLPQKKAMSVTIISSVCNLIVMKTQLEFYANNSTFKLYEKHNLAYS